MVIDISVKNPIIPELKSFLREIAIPDSHTEQRQLKNSGSFWDKVFTQHPADRSSARQSRQSPNPVQTFKVEIAGWVNMPKDIHTVILLGFEYTDVKGTHRHIVDAMPARGAAQILLSGKLEIEVVGQHSDLDLYCYGIEERSVWVDDLHIDLQRIVAKGVRAA